jgi:hypothetical protein
VVPRTDLRWDDQSLEWDEPDLPKPVMRAPLRVAAAEGPFAGRLRSIFEDRPEAVDRLCAAAEARAAIVGDEQLEKELLAEVAAKKWKDRRAPAGQLERLRALAAAENQPASWRRVATLLLGPLTPKPDVGV